MRKYLSLSPALAFLALLSTSMQFAAPCSSAEQCHSVIERSIVIKACPKTVFEGIQSSRSDDPRRRQLVSHSQDVAIIDEKLADLPVIGSAHLIYKEIEIPFKRIDYLLLSSDKFKAFEGSWELTPLDNGHETRVVLKSYSEVKVWAPFARELAANSTVKDINRRLGNLKHFCDEQMVREAKSHGDERVVSYSGSHNHNRSQLAEVSVGELSNIGTVESSRADSPRE